MSTILPSHWAVQRSSATVWLSTAKTWWSSTAECRRKLELSGDDATVAARPSKSPESGLRPGYARRRLQRTARPRPPCGVRGGLVAGRPAVAGGRAQPLRSGPLRPAGLGPLGVLGPAPAGRLAADEHGGGEHGQPHRAPGRPAKQTRALSCSPR